MSIQPAMGLLTSKAVIFNNMHNDLSACCAHKGETGTVEPAQVLLTQTRTEKWSFALSWSQDSSVGSVSD